MVVSFGVSNRAAAGQSCRRAVRVASVATPVRDVFGSRSRARTAVHLSVTIIAAGSDRFAAGPGIRSFGLTKGSR